MSKKKIYNKQLEKGRFYIHSDGHGGHPALLYKKRDRKNVYFIVVFTSSPGPKRKKLKHSIEPIKIKTTFVHNTPKISKRKELSSRYMDGLKIHKEDKPLIKTIEKNDSQDQQRISICESSISIKTSVLKKYNIIDAKDFLISILFNNT